MPWKSAFEGEFLKIYFHIPSLVIYEIILITILHAFSTVISKEMQNFTIR